MYKNPKHVSLVRVGTEEWAAPDRPSRTSTLKLFTWLPFTIFIHKNSRPSLRDVSWDRGTQYMREVLRDGAISWLNHRIARRLRRRLRKGRFQKWDDRKVCFSWLQIQALPSNHRVLNLHLRKVRSHRECWCLRTLCGSGEKTRREEKTTLDWWGSTQRTGTDSEGQIKLREEQTQWWGSHDRSHKDLKFTSID